MSSRDSLNLCPWDSGTGWLCIPQTASQSLSVVLCWLPCSLPLPPAPAGSFWSSSRSKATVSEPGGFSSPGRLEAFRSTSDHYSFVDLNEPQFTIAFWMSRYEDEKHTGGREGLGLVLGRNWGLPGGGQLTDQRCPTKRECQPHKFFQLPDKIIAEKQLQLG